MAGKFDGILTIIIGIPDDKVSNLFQRFYQVDPSITSQYGGKILRKFFLSFKKNQKKFLEISEKKNDWKNFLYTQK